MPVLNLIKGVDTVTSETTTPISPVRQIESMYQRLEKARSIYAAGKVHPIVGLDGQYAVECSRIDDGMYLVNGTCTCIDAQQRIDIHHGWCKHKLSVELFKEQQALHQVSKNDRVMVETDSPLEDQLEDLYPKARN
jgi:hypothetical protein